jgi:hypothetical protein
MIHLVTDQYRGRGHTVTYEPYRVLPPELLRTLPEWRALIVRGNLSPVIVRLRMAWRRSDYRHARQRTGTPRRPIPGAATEPWPEQSQVTGDARIVLPPGGAWDHSQPRQQPADADDELAGQRTARPPNGTPHRLIPPGADPSSPPSSGDPRPPRPRRPWEPPADFGGRK